MMLFRAIAAVAALSYALPAIACGQDDELALLRSRVRHVFIIYQENHSFDNYFGTFPGADNLASAEALTHGFRQYDPLGKSWITPFRIDDPDTESPSQSRTLVTAKMNGGAMDAFVSAQETASQKRFDPAAARDVGLLTMAHYDCDTIPFLWKYARSFALYDHMFSALTGPSTPNAIGLIAAQAGDVTDDLDPAYGPYAEADKKYQLSQRYVTLMLELAGSDAAQVTEETAGVEHALGAAATSGRGPIPWGWYQEGYVSPSVALPGYEAHHNAPQYFGYLRENDVFWRNVHNLPAMLGALRDGTLPERGIFYVKGGSRNGFGWKPANRDAYVQANYLGDDDHPGPGDTDAQIGEAFVATFVNAIARSKYWQSSAIVVTWDDPGGYYDHVPPPQFERCADGLPCGDGPRLPFLLISPYARGGAIVSDPGDQTSILKFAERLFGLPAVASRDANPAIGDLVAGFDRDRLNGSAPPIPAESAQIPDDVVNSFPARMNCRSLGIVPIALSNAPSAPPPNFNPRPPRPRRSN